MTRSCVIRGLIPSVLGKITVGPTLTRSRAHYAPVNGWYLILLWGILGAWQQQKDSFSIEGKSSAHGLGDILIVLVVRKIYVCGCVLPRPSQKEYNLTLWDKAGSDWDGFIIIPRNTKAPCPENDKSCSYYSLHEMGETGRINALLLHESISDSVSN